MALSPTTIMPRLRDRRSIKSSRLKAILNITSSPVSLFETGLFVQTDPSRFLARADSILQTFAMRPLFIFLLPLLVSLSSMAAPIRVTVWDERQPAQKQVYTNFLGNQIADHLRQSSDFSVRSVALDDPQQGLADLKDTDVLIWWGHVRHGEIKPEMAREIVRQIKDRGLALIALHSAHWSQPFVEAMHERARVDALAALDPRERETAILVETNLFPNFRSVPKYNSLRSPAVLYRKPTNGPVEVRLTLPNCCFPAYRADAKPSQIRILRPFHPIARGIPPIFT